MPVLEGKNAVITGSSMGIGRAVAIELAEQGANVVLNSSSSSDSLAQTLADVQAIGARAVSCAGSVADATAAQLLIDRCIEEFGSIDILINVAGIVEPPGSSILSIETEDWLKQIDVHLNGTFYTCRHAARYMVEQGYGSIINTCSHALTGSFGGTGYAAAKGGVYSLSLALAKDLGEYGIRVNAICPGAESRMSTGTDYETHIDRLYQRGILDQGSRDASLNPAPPQFVAPAYALLASELSVDITGRIFSVAGGYIGEFRGFEETLLAYKDHSGGEKWGLTELANELQKSLI